MSSYARFAMVLAAATIATQLAAGRAFAAQVDTLSVTRHDDDFRIVFDARVDAPAREVYEVLADYDRLYRLSPVISEISVQPSPDGRSDRVRSVLKACVMFLCQSLVQVEDVTEPDEHTIVGEMIPAKSDFSRGHCEWRITADGPRTRLHYEATRTMSAPIVPLIGTWVVKRAMSQNLRSSVFALERLINGSKLD